MFKELIFILGSTLVSISSLFTFNYPFYTQINAQIMPAFKDYEICCLVRWCGMMWCYILELKFFIKPNFNFEVRSWRISWSLNKRLINRHRLCWSKAILCSFSWQKNWTYYQYKIKTKLVYIFIFYIECITFFDQSKLMSLSFT